MMLKNTYLVIRETTAPSVVLMTADEADGWRTRHAMALASARPSAWLDATRMQFGHTDVHAVIPCWLPDAMAQIAMEYQGPQATAVKGLAAAIALGRPWSQGRDYGQADDSGKSDGGQPVRPRPRSPKGPAPLGGVFAQVGAQGAA